MTTSVVLGLLFGIGALLVLSAQPIGRPKPSIRRRLDQLRPDSRVESDHSGTAVFRSAMLEELLRPWIERAGTFALSIARSAGLDLKQTTSRLNVVGDAGGLSLFLGQKIAGAVLGVAFLPLATAIGGIPPTPSWIWLVAGGAGFMLPDAMLRSKAEARRCVLKEELARFADLTALCVSAGQGLESALEQVAASSDGPFFEQLRRSLRETRLRGEPAVAAISAMTETLDLSEAEPLASALRAADEHGLQVSHVLRSQARAIRDRRRIELIEAGERAPARMAIPVGVLILPAFFIVILYPAAVQLLQVTSR